jgi:CheY-like chemotaxis protein
VAEALALIRSARPDLLVTDIGMPGADGYELLERVRELEDAALASLPAIALTAFARSEDRTRALRTGFLLHLSKPVEPAELIATVASAASRTGRRG